jgi:hypothetical protein
MKLAQTAGSERSSNIMANPLLFLLGMKFLGFFQGWIASAAGN